MQIGFIRKDIHFKVSEYLKTLKTSIRITIVGKSGNGHAGEVFLCIFPFR